MCARWLPPLRPDDVADPASQAIEGAATGSTEKPAGRDRAGQGVDRVDLGRQRRTRGRGVRADGAARTSTSWSPPPRRRYAMRSASRPPARSTGAERRRHPGTTASVATRCGMVPATTRQPGVPRPPRRSSSSATVIGSPGEWSSAGARSATVRPALRAVRSPRQTWSSARPVGCLTRPCDGVLRRAPVGVAQPSPRLSGGTRSRRRPRRSTAASPSPGSKAYSTRSVPRGVFGSQMLTWGRRHRSPRTAGGRLAGRRRSGRPVVAGARR